MIRVQSKRDGLIDEFHDCVVCGAGYNDLPDYPFYLRSCAKPLQASLLIDVKADLTEEELAFCCGSHAGEDCHVNLAHKIMNKYNISIDELKCGIHPPLSKTKLNSMLLNNEQPNQIHNNCSGKHIGFLVICKIKGWNTDNYYLPEHSLQKMIKQNIINLCELKTNYPDTTDGCGVPIMSMPLNNIIKGYRNLLINYPLIIKAIKNNPYIFGGEDRTDTEIIQKTDTLISKVGAGGLCVVLNIKENEAFVLKVNDCSYEARKIAVYSLINRIKWGHINFDDAIKTIHGKIVGHIEVIDV